MVQNVTKGYHGTVFAYGQTGAGKTYTIEGYKYSHNENGKFKPLVLDAKKNDTYGILQRSSNLLLELLEPIRKERKIGLSVSYMQLYNEKIYDLLNDHMFKKKTLVYNKVKGGPNQGL